MLSAKWLSMAVLRSTSHSIQVKKWAANDSGSGPRRACGFAGRRAGQLAPTLCAGSDVAQNSRETRFVQAAFTPKS